jgi:hypothetical protein
MKLLATAGAALILLSLGATAATAAPASNPLAAKVTALQKQVKALAKANTALTSQVTSLKGSVASLQGGVSSLQGTVTTLQGNVGALAATLTCDVAQLGTIDYTFLDLFLLIAGQPEQYQGQVVPDNGACAAAGITPPSPAAAPYLGSETPTAITVVAGILGVLSR